MKAIRLRSEDGPEALEYVDVPDPAAGDGEVLIDVQAAGVSFVDLLMTRGQYQERPDCPFVPGLEVAGTVRESPSGTFAPGERVAAYVKHGGYAEITAAPANTTFRLPDGIDFAGGTALALNYQTAHFALVRRGQLKEGQTVLVHGAAGGVGSAALQVARARGATTVAVVRSKAKAALAVAAGADHVVLAEDGWADEARRLAPGGFALVLDPVGGPVFEASYRLLAAEGRYLVVGFAGSGIPTLALNRILLRNIDVVGVGWGAFLRADPEMPAAVAAELARLASSGALDPPLGRRYPLAEAAHALNDLASGTALGKLVLEP